MKIGIFTDSHYCTKEVLNKTRRPILSPQKLAQAIEDFKKSNVELIICLGDLVDTDISNDQNEANLKLITNMVHDTGIECFCCMGNHDGNLFTRDKFEIISRMKLSPTTHSLGENLLIFLDANHNSDGKAYEPGAVNWKDTFVPESQIKFLEDTLQASNQKNVYVFMHQNIDPLLPKNHLVANAEKIREILSKHSNVKAVYQGHYHYGGQNIHDGIQYITLKAMCEGELDMNSYKIIEI